MVRSAFKLVWLVSGYFCVAIAAVGIVLPLLPTVPFLLLAAFCFSKSSPKLYNALINHHRFGPPIVDWQNHGVIQTKYKCLALIMMWLMVSYSLIMVIDSWVLRSAVLIVVLAVSVFIITRPGQRA